MAAGIRKFYLPLCQGKNNYKWVEHGVIFCALVKDLLVLTSKSIKKNYMQDLKFSILYQVTLELERALETLRR